MPQIRELMMPEILEDYLTPEKFQNWLRSQPPDKVIGSTRDGSVCPMANYLHSKGLQFLHVLHDRIKTLCQEHNAYEDVTGMPTWASCFVAEVDALSCAYSHLLVTAAEALECLYRACPWLIDSVPETTPKPVEDEAKEVKPAFEPKFEIVA